MNAQDGVRLRIHSGVPIVDVLGDWAPSVADAVHDLIRSLTETGHFDIVLNIQRVTVGGIAGLGTLTRLAEGVRSHCGHIDVVGTVDQVSELVKQQTDWMFRLAISEETAIGRIKRMPILSSGERFTARPIG